MRTEAKKLLAKSLMLIITCVLSSNIYAGAKTNLNKTTDLFDLNIKNKNALFEDLNQKNEKAINSIKSKEAFGLIEGHKGAEQNASQLNSIKASDLDNAGRVKRTSEEFKFYDENELEPDYTRSGNIQQKLDANEISELTAKKMFDLRNKLNELGLDCKTVKGAVEKEPTYHIEIRREEHKNTEYDQFFCEERRNKYNCQDQLRLKCAKKGMKWNPWQYKVAKVPGRVVYDQARHLGYAVFWKKKRYGWHISSNSPGWRVFLASYLNIPLIQIHENISFPNGNRGVGDITPLYDQWRVKWDHYLIGYNYRYGVEICTEWAEEWTERCVLQ